MIVSTLACALLLSDDFTGNPIPGSGALFRSGGRPVRPVSRPDGCYLFLDGEDRGGQALELSVSLPGYLDRQMTIDTRCLPAHDRLVIRRLVRACCGVYRDCEWVRGTGPPGRRVLALAKEDPQLRFHPLPEAERDGEGPALRVSGYSARRLERLRYAVELPGEGVRDFVLGESLGGSSYRVEPGEWGQAESFPLRRGFCSRCDERGEYRIPVEPGCEIQAVYAREGEGWDCLSAAAPN